MKAGPGWSKLSLRLTPPLTQDEFAQSPLGVFAPGGLVQRYSAYRTESRRFNRKVRVAVALFVSHAFHLRKDGHRRDIGGVLRANPRRREAVPAAAGPPVFVTSRARSIWHRPIRAPSPP